ncbi:MAG: hypothetical protein SV375_02725 [Thermodesulfobacteriota bacterium]|nr:hypothetical protein [Thermodesulfobacteriota bacterium]
MGQKNDLIITGLMAISDFVFSAEFVEDLARRVSTICLRFDKLNGNQEVWEKTLDTLYGSRIKPNTIVSNQSWNRWNWREELLRMLDPIQPGYVLFLDSDEKYDSNFDDDFTCFQEKGADIMMFDYEMITEDGRQVRKYPGARHCKAFRWTQGISYIPYQGYAKPNFPNDEIVFLAKSKIQHYCFFTKKMEKTKLLHK